jgi:hypothetical protein
MGIEHIRWWMWILISLPVGWLLAYVNSNPIQPTEMRTDEQVYFEQNILHAPVHAGGQDIQWVRNLTVYPPTSAVNRDGSTIQIMPVTYEVLIPLAGGTAGEYEYVPSWFGAHVPYGPSRGSNRANAGTLPPGMEETYVPAADATLGSITQAVYGKDTPEGRNAIAMANYTLFGLSHSIAELIKMRRFRPGQRLFVPWNPAEGKTVRDWLDTASHQAAWVHYEFAWWKVPKYCRMLWMGIAFGVIGVLWPMALLVLSGAGLSGRRVKESDYDLSRFGSGKSMPAPRAGAAELDEAGRASLSAMNASLTASLAADATDGGATPPAAAAGGAAGAAAIPAKPLVAETLAPPVAEQPQKSSKDYKGEFYPVAKGEVKSDPDKPKGQ